MADIGAAGRFRCGGTVVAQDAVSQGLVRLDIVLERPLSFAPGQFAMVNLDGPGQLVFSRPFSILAADGDRVSFLYRVVGRGTALLAGSRSGDRVTFLGPLGRGFPAPRPGETAVLVAGGVGLPPLHAWLAQHGRSGDLAFFGGRDGHDVPWGLLDDRWGVSVDRCEGVPADQGAFHGLVTDLAAARTEGLEGPAALLACGPRPLLEAAAALARRRGWTCWLSLEEHMGCGYGVCKGCVVPVREATQGTGWRNATCCDEGPVFAAESVAWERWGASPLERAD